MWEYAKVKNGVQKLRMRGTGLLIQLSSPGAEIPCRLCVLGRRNAGNDTSLVKTSSNFLPIRRRESKKMGLHQPNQESKMVKKNRGMEQGQHNLDDREFLGYALLAF